MKVNIEIDCTPEEARTFFGLPDVGPMQDRLLKVMEERLTETLNDSDPDKLMAQWMPIGVKGVEQWQSMWTQLASAAAGMARPKGPKSG